MALSQAAKLRLVNELSSQVNNLSANAANAERTLGEMRVSVSEQLRQEIKGVGIGDILTIRLKDLAPKLVSLHSSICKTMGKKH